MEENLGKTLNLTMKEKIFETNRVVKGFDCFFYSVGKELQQQLRIDQFKETPRLKACFSGFLLLLFCFGLLPRQSDKKSNLLFQNLTANPSLPKEYTQLVWAQRLARARCSRTEAHCCSIFKLKVWFDRCRHLTFLHTTPCWTFRRSRCTVWHFTEWVSVSHICTLLIIFNCSYRFPPLS